MELQVRDAEKNAISASTPCWILSIDDSSFPMEYSWGSWRSPGYGARFFALLACLLSRLMVRLLYGFLSRILSPKILAIALHS